MKFYIILGPPGAGKGTQSALLAKKYSLLHISTGDMLRKEIEAGTELGIQVKQTIESGKLVDDETMLKLIKKIISEPQEGIKGFILDGFPRTLPQAEALDKMLSERKDSISAVIYLDIDEDIIFQRISYRAKMEDRKDDMERSTIENRIVQYHTKTEPLIVYYSNKGIFYRIKGDKSIEENFKEICSIIDKIEYKR